MLWVEAGEFVVGLAIMVPYFGRVNAVRRIMSTIHGSPVGSYRVVIMSSYSASKAHRLLRGRVTTRIDRMVCRPIGGNGKTTLEDNFTTTANSVMVIRSTSLRCSPRRFPIIVSPVVGNQTSIMFKSQFRNNQPRHIICC